MLQVHPIGELQGRCRKICTERLHAQASKQQDPYKIILLDSRMHLQHLQYWQDRSAGWQDLTISSDRKVDFLWLLPLL